jgi:hypothetical protein
MAGTHDNASGDFAIVDLRGRLVFWCYLRQSDVCKYNTRMTGLSAAKMQMGLTPETVKHYLSISEFSLCFFRNRNSSLLLSYYNR